MVIPSEVLLQILRCLQDFYRRVTMFHGFLLQGDISFCTGTLFPAWEIWERSWSEEIRCWKIFEGRRLGLRKGKDWNCPCFFFAVVLLGPTLSHLSAISEHSPFFSLSNSSLCVGNLACAGLLHDLGSGKCNINKISIYTSQWKRQRFDC